MAARETIRKKTKTVEQVIIATVTANTAVLRVA